MLSDTSSLSILYSQITTLPEKGRFQSSSVLDLCMEFNRSTQTALTRQRLQGRQSSPALHQLQTPDRRGQQPYSSPLPQTQWSEIPSPYRPRDLLEPEQRLYSHGPRNTQPQTYRSSTAVPSPPQHRSDQGQGRPRRRVRVFRDLLQRESKDDGQNRRVDASMLYPQLNPYTNDHRLSTYSAPDELDWHHARTVSQTGAPGYLDTPARGDVPLPLNVPRSPTYPPAGRRRMHSAEGVGDAAFADEAEYRLFVEATAGLGPEQAFRSFDPVSPLASSPRRTQSERISTINPTSPRDVISPFSETPTTRLALQQLAQMPYGSSHTSLEPLQTTHSSVGMWVQPPSAEPDDLLEGSFLGLDLEDEHFDDELPGYAESQAQAQQHQRAEAARRAQELQMRWQLSGGRRGV